MSSCFGLRGKVAPLLFAFMKFNLVELLSNYYYDGLKCVMVIPGGYKPAFTSTCATLAS